MKKLNVLSFLVATSFSLLCSVGFAAEASGLRKLDILFVIDNSGSMSAAQSQLQNNLTGFLNTLEGNLVKTAITTTDAFYGDQFIGNGCSICNVNQTKFQNSVQVGINGSGDERAFSSIKAALSSPLNVGFQRPGAYLAVIIISDGDDFSHDDMGLNESYSQATLHPVEKYVSFLRDFTNGKPKKDFSVSTVGVLDVACKDQLVNGENKIANRYMQLTNLTGGTKASICLPFKLNLDQISQTLVADTTLQ